MKLKILIACLCMLFSQLQAGWNQSLSRWGADCSVGLASGCSIVGSMYEKGTLVTWNGRENITTTMPIDTTKALRFYQKGCNLGDALSCDRYRKLSLKISTQRSKKSVERKTNPLSIKTEKTYKLLSEKLYGYGDSISYGFEQLGHVKMEHALIGFYPMGFSRQLVIASSKPKRAYDCHACAPKMSFFLFNNTSGKWLLEHSYINAHSMGSWGTSPDSKAYKIIKIGDYKYGLSLKASGAWQGHFSENIRIYSFGETKMNQLFEAETRADDSATGETPKNTWNANIELKKGSGDYYDIVMYKQGIEEGKKIDYDIYYRFNGEKYIRNMTKISHRANPQNMPRKRYISTPMRNGGKAVATAGKHYFKFEFVGDGDIYDVEITKDSFRSIHMLGGYAECAREGDRLINCKDFGVKQASIRYQYDGKNYEFEIKTIHDGKHFKTYFYSDKNYLYWASYKEDKVLDLQKFKIASKH